MRAPPLPLGIVVAALSLALVAGAQEASEGGAPGASEAEEAPQGSPAASPLEAESAPALPETRLELEALPEPEVLPDAKSIEELLDFVQRGYSEEREENRAREARFAEAKADQARLLEQALAILAREEAGSERREELFAANEAELTELSEELDERLGNLGELFGVVRQVAGDMQGHAWESVTSSQLADREALLGKLGRSKALPSTEDLEALWYELLREMDAQGKVVRYPAAVLTTEGDEERREVTRAGVFSVVSGGRYLHWDPDIQKLRELNRQPPSRYLETVEPFEASSDGGFSRLAIDPSRGSLLAALIDTPNVQERIGQGGPVGYTIIVLGTVALIVAVYRWIAVSIVSRKVAAQAERETPDRGNPLGRVLAVYDDNRDASVESLEMKLGEAVIRELSMLERLLWLVKVVSVVAPLMGLLGTVTGMIQTFQAITLFGAGDPKMMAGGISEALVTTMLGLTVAIPLVLMHAAIGNNIKQVTDVLAEQSSGLVAQRAEQAGD